MNPCEHMDGLDSDLAHAAEEIKRLITQRDELVIALEDALSLIETISPFEGDTVRKAKSTLKRVRDDKT